MDNEAHRWQRRYEREHTAKLAAQTLLETISTKLYDANSELKLLNENMEELVKERTQQLEIAKNEALASAKAKSDFLANISHEVRTPMNAVMGMLHAIQMTADKDKQQKYLSVALESGQHLTSLINDVLEYSQLNPANLELDESRFDLVDVVDSCIQSFAVPAAEKKLDFIPEILIQTPYRVRSDKEQVKKIINNLISNAVKFTSKGGVNVVLRETDAEEIELRVEDTGVGIPEEAFQKIFEEFSQADTSATREFGGTGIGLSICAKLVAAMGFRIEIESQLGVGSTFSVLMPKKALQATKTKAVAKSVSYKKSDIFLVTEDAQVVRALSHWANVREDIDIHCYTTDSDCTNLEVDISSEKNTEREKIILVDFGQFIIEDWDLKCIHEETSTSLFFIAPLLLDDSAIPEWIDGVIYKPWRQSDLDQLITEEKTGTGEESGLSGLTAIAGTRKKLLVVDDNPLNLQVVSTLLESSDMQLIFANNGAEAVEQTKLNHPDLVLMDIQMPVMDGLTATKEIRRLGGRFNTLPIIAMTAHALAEDKRKSLEAGLNAHITKPVDPQKLHEVLQQWLPHISNPAKKEQKQLPEYDLPQLEGFELEDAVKRLRGRWPKLKSLIIQFIENNSDVDQRLTDLLVSKQWEDAQRLAHQIKGSGANLGAAAISRTAAAIEQALRSNAAPIDESLVEEFTEQTQQLVAALSILKEETPKTRRESEEKTISSHSVDKKTSAEIINELQVINGYLPGDLGRAKERLEPLLDSARGTALEAPLEEILDVFYEFQIKQTQSLISSLLAGHSEVIRETGHLTDY